MTADVLIVGGGVVGTAAARALARTEPRLRIHVLEKETELSRHQSGRNSGVVHVGYNQKPGTLKARFVVEGARRLKDYCRRHRVPFEERGILVVAREERERTTLEELERRGRENGAEVERIGSERLRRLEPHAAGLEALWAPTGASVDSRGFVQALASEAQAAGVRFLRSAEFRSVRHRGTHLEAVTGRGSVRTRVLVNAAGLHADRIARGFGVGRDVRVVPFRGEYFDLVPERRSLVRAHVYPVPDLRFPFVGVHLSRRTDGRVSVGPGAVWVPGRETYEGWSALFEDIEDAARFPGLWRLLASRAFRRLAAREWKKAVFPGAVLREARRLVPGLRLSDLGAKWSGIRAQLVSGTGRLIGDLRIEETENSIHVLNAVSPALTCALPFADELVRRVRRKL